MNVPENVKKKKEIMLLKEFNIEFVQEKEE